jgi:putative hydrolase of the HAD superfamily
MTRPPITAALLDVGGTLWPDGWPWLPEDHQTRTDRLRQALPGLEPASAARLLAALDASADRLAHSLEQDPAVYVGEPLRDHGIEPTPERVAAVIDAMCLPAKRLVELLPGARELLRTVKRLGLRSVIVSNTYWRTAGAYLRDFEDLGVAQDIDAIVSSADVGFRKPHPAVFEAAVAAAGVPAAECVMVGNSEPNDVVAPRALGIHAIRVAIQEPLPSSSQADAVTDSLEQVADLLRSWVAAP